jgi:hypothetical protein
MTDNSGRQVREVLKEVYAAWEANDADAFARPYAESAELAGCCFRLRRYPTGCG